MSRGQERHHAGAFDRGREFPLVPGTDAGPGAGQDFHVEVDEATQSARVFIINIKIINAEIAFFGFFIAHNIYFNSRRPRRKRRFYFY